jgi:hypothetical protein
MKKSLHSDDHFLQFQQNVQSPLSLTILDLLQYYNITTSVVIGTDSISKSNYHTITVTTAP